MNKYLVHVNYNSEGTKGLLAEGGSSRKAAAETAIKSVGGNLESMYFAFGETDCYAIANLPSQNAAIALSLTLNASGRVTTSLTPLITVEEMDDAVKLSPSYRAPGQ
jgi:uncharacterized protein with GYD domain